MMLKPNLNKLDILDLKTPSMDINDISATLKVEDRHRHLDDTVLKLSDYLSAVQLVVKETFAHHVWVKAEIRNLSTKGGHYYFELAEKDDSGNILASARGNLWRYQTQRVLHKFERATNMPLERGLTVLMKVQATLHPQYGFSLNISDIDPSYTLGDLARHYAQMLEKLESQGLLRLNATLPTPFDIANVLVIAPENAAGLGDFRAEADKLSTTNACQFFYQYSTFQGNHAPEEVRYAILTGLSNVKTKLGRLPDLIVIIRGGGAVGDLAYLNDYELAAVVAELPIPVWVGIGHERDRVILDEVAHTSFDTPSKVIIAIIDHLQALVNQAKSYMQCIAQSSSTQINHATATSQRQLESIKSYSQFHLKHWQHQTKYTYNILHHSASYQIKSQRHDQHQLLIEVHKFSKHQLKQSHGFCTKILSSMSHQSSYYIKQTQSEIEQLRRFIMVQHPTRMLNQGYAWLTSHQGELIKSVYQLNHSDVINIQLSDGKSSASIISIHPNTQG